jgi:hypothetical protein
LRNECSGARAAVIEPNSRYRDYADGRVAPVLRNALFVFGWKISICRNHWTLDPAMSNPVRVSREITSHQDGRIISADPTQFCLARCGVVRS